MRIVYKHRAGAKNWGVHVDNLRFAACRFYKPIKTYIYVGFSQMAFADTGFYFQGRRPGYRMHTKKNVS